ncbi:hypothetical protein ACRRTK_009877 [Alexandromys fortis]
MKQLVTKSTRVFSCPVERQGRVGSSSLTMPFRDTVPAILTETGATLSLDFEQGLTYRETTRWR